MTNEEAIEILKNLLKNEDPSTNPFGELFSIEATAIKAAIAALRNQPRWIPCSKRMPDKEFEEGVEKGTVMDLYPCLVTRYATHSLVNPKRLYVAKHYYDGDDFVNNGQQECTESVVAWMPLPEPFKGGETE